MDQLMEDLNLKDQSRHLLLQSFKNISLRKKQKSQMMQNQEDLKFNQLDQELQMIEEKRDAPAVADKDAATVATSAVEAISVVAP